MTIKDIQFSSVAQIKHIRKVIKELYWESFSKLNNRNHNPNYQNYSIENPQNKRFTGGVYCWLILLVLFLH